MAKIELSITSDYQRKWGVWEGLREIVCNGQDAQTELNAPLKVSYKPATFHAMDAERVSGTVTVENTGCTIPREALLLGHSTKMDRGDVIGQFGEGFKIGVLALVRAGAGVTLRNGSEVWVASLQRSEKFSATVLTFDVTGGRKSENRVRVEISGITAEDWAECRARLRFLDKQDGEHIATPSGTLLLDPELRGRIYTKGVFITIDTELVAGYDFTDGQLNRDRSLVETYDLRSRMLKVWEHASRARPDLFTKFYTLCQDDAPDVRGVSEYSAAWAVSDDIRQLLADKFKADFGESAVPVSNIAESKDIEHFGRTGIVVPKGLAVALGTKLADLAKVKAGAKNDVVKRYGWHELSDAQKASFLQAEIIIGNVRPQWDFKNVEVVDFRDASVRGQYTEGRVLVRSRDFATTRNALRVLVHEFAHAAGGDGDVDHIQASEETWADIAESLFVPHGVQ